jgi:hypothetical protein
MQALERFWKDIRRGENIDLYVTVTAAIVLAILNIIGIAPQTWAAPLILAVLAVLAFAALVNRHKLDTLLQTINQASRKLLLGDYPADLESDVRRAKEIWIVGVSLYATTMKYYSLLEKKLKEGCSIKTLLVNPDGQAIQMAATRKYGPVNVEHERTRVRTSLQRLCELHKIAEGRLDIRTLDNPLTFGAFAIDPETSGGVLYVEHYGFKTRRENVRRLVLHQDDEGWYDSIKTEIYELWKAGTKWRC